MSARVGFPPAPLEARTMRPILRLPSPSFLSSLWCVLAIGGLGIGYVAFRFEWGLMMAAVGGVVGKLIEYRLPADRLASKNEPAGLPTAF